MLPSHGGQLESVIIPQARTHGVMAQARTHGVMAQARTHSVMAQARMHSVMAQAPMHSVMAQARMHSVIPQARSACRDLLPFAPKPATIAWEADPDTRSLRSLLRDDTRRVNAR
jgi:hypothetical protein